MSDTWAQRAPWTGIAAVVLIVLAAVIGGETPDFDASPAEIVDYYEGSTQVWVSFLATLGAISFVFFAATLRSALRRAEGLSTLVLIGGALFGFGLAIFSGLTFALSDLADSDNRVDPGALQALNSLNTDLFFPVFVGVCVFYFSTALAIFSTGALPRWLGWVTLVLAVISLLGPGAFLAFLALAPWTLVASIMLLRGPGGSASPGGQSGAEGPRAEYRENPVG